MCMKCILRLRSVLLLLVATLFFGGAALAQSDDGMVEWFDDYDQATAEAKRTGKPIFLEFRCAP